jgi:ferredoxin-thioredoxin reductase catalytic subunit
MKGYELNKNREYVNQIIEGIYKKNGHCPCRVNVDDTTLCPCNEFVSEGICKCKLFVKKEEVEK